MKAKIFLRVASVLTLIHAILHTIGGVFGKPDPGPSSTVWAAMQSVHFPVFGMDRTYFQFYRGLGLGITIALTCDALVFWILGSLASTVGPKLRPLLWVFAFAYLAISLNSFLYFFLLPVLFELIIVACIVAAIVDLKPAKA
ncbi:MAG TPA: hypothetical protein VK716_05210 [Terracidiphilus sp.]|nr:hypothetical protein [Terracidiphilus sp.]